MTAPTEPAGLHPDGRRPTRGRLVPADPIGAHDPPPTPTDVDALVTHLDALLVRVYRVGYHPDPALVDRLYDALCDLRDLLGKPPAPPTGTAPGSSAEVYP